MNTRSSMFPCKSFGCLLDFLRALGFVYDFLEMGTAHCGRLDPAPCDVKLWRFIGRWGLLKRLNVLWEVEGEDLDLVRLNWHRMCG